MSRTVAVVGGGYGGSAVAKALDETADVVLIEPKEAFFHAVGALRATVDAAFAPRVFFPYDNLLSRGRVVRDRAVRVEPNVVTLASGERLTADYVVLASGSSYPFPAKSDVDETAAARQRYDTVRRNLEEARQVLLLGAGPVGLEFAGEIKAAWPDKAVVIVDPASEILGGYDPALRDEVRRQLAELDIRLVLGCALRDEPRTSPGETGTVQVSTTSGLELAADIWFRCFGVSPNTYYLAGALADARLTDGRIAVSDTLQVKGQGTVFALGDVTDVAEAKRAGAAMRHADVVARNITVLIDGIGDQLETYSPGPSSITLPLGPTGGATQLPGQGVVGAKATAQRKGTDLMTGHFRSMFGTRG